MSVDSGQWSVKRQAEERTLRLRSGQASGSRERENGDQGLEKHGTFVRRGGRGLSATADRLEGRRFGVFAGSGTILRWVGVRRGELAGRITLEFIHPFFEKQSTRRSRADCRTLGCQPQWIHGSRAKNRQLSLSKLELAAPHRRLTKDFR